MNISGLIHRVVRIISDAFVDSLVDRKAIFVWHGCIVLAVVSFYGQAQTVTADFGGRSGSTAVVPSGFFSVSGIGDPLADPAAIASLTSAGLNRTRSGLAFSRSTQPPPQTFSVLDSQLQIISASGVHAIGVIYDTPPSLGSNQCGPPSDIKRWGQLAASVVAHVDRNFPGVLLEYEIWNEPELPTSLCISDDTTRLNTYVAMFAAAASAMHAQAQADGVTIHTGGPVICHVGEGGVWIPALLNNALTAPYVDFVSFHIYMTGQTNIDNGMTWQDLYSQTQALHGGLANAYTWIEPFVRAGHQPNPASTPIYISEFNENWAFSVDCCRNDPTYGPLWNSLAVTDFLNVVYSGATAVPSRIVYYNASGKYFCLLGAWDADMDCDGSEMQPYPQLYAFQLFASPDYLDLQAGAHMAASVSPVSTTSGLSATAFYTASTNSVVVVNPTSTAYAAVTVAFENPGLASVAGKTHLLDASHGQIATEAVSFSSMLGRYWTSVAVPAYATVAVSMQGTPVPGAPSAEVSVSPRVGSHPLKVSIDSWQSSGGGSAMVGRTIDFGDGKWANWTASTTHTYAEPGTYTVVLSVRNQSGQLASTTSVVTVK